MRGKSIKLYIMGESYKNLKTAELSNWSGKAYIGQRKHINILQKFEELSAPGIYFLSSDIEGSYQKKLYIGEADEISKRLSNHFKNKDWWDNFICFISKDSNLTKAHVRYLEKKIYEIAINNKTTLEVSNINIPPGSKLPVSDCDDMDEYCDHVIFILKNLGIIDFTKINVPIIEGSEEIQRSVELTSKNIFYMNVLGPKGVKSKQAKLIISDGVYILLEGSYIKRSSVDSFDSHNYARLRKQLEKDNYFIESNSKYFLKLNKNVEFSSPSAAAAIVRNSSMNGRKAWKMKNGLTLDDYENKII